jgi:hypothetical protein
MEKKLGVMALYVPVIPVTAGNAKMFQFSLVKK